MLNIGKKFVLFLAALMLYSAAASGEIEVSGRVVSSQGEGLADARISLFATRNRYIQGELVRGATRRDPPLASATSNAGGHYQLSAPAAGLYTVVAELPGLLPWEYPLALVEPRHLPNVALTKAMEHQVRVLDDEGHAIRGAFATVGEASRWSRQSPASGDWLPASQLAQSDEEGRMFFSRETVRGVDLLVWAPGYLEAEPHSGKTGYDEVRLHRGVERVVEVRNATGELATGTLVRLGVGRWPAGRTGSDGRLTLVTPPDRSLPLELVTPEGRTTSVSLLPPRAEALPEPEVLAEVLYLQQQQIEGRVVKSVAGGEPLAGALLWAGADRGVYAWSDPQGGFSLPCNEPSGEIKLFAEAPRHLGQRTDGLSVDGPVELVLQPATALLGRVVDDEDHPVADAEIQVHTDLSRNDFLAPPLSVASRSDATGRFRLPRLPDAPIYELIVRAPGFAAMRFSVTPPESDSEVRLVLGPGITTVGSVRDASGQPVAHAMAILYPSRGTRRDRLLVDDVHMAQSLVDGSFAIPHVLAGRYELGLSAEGYAPKIVRGLDVTKTAQPFDLGTVFLEPEATLQGRVTDARGQPLEGVHVSFLSLVYEVGPRDDQLSTMKVTYTDEEGRFVVTQLEAGGQVDLKLQRRGYQPRELFGLEVSATEAAAIVLEPVAEVAGRVIDPNGEAVASAQVVMRPRGEGWTGGEPPFGPDPGQQSISTNARGQFMLGTADPGLYVLNATAQGYLRSPDVEVEVGYDRSTQVVTLVLGQGARLVGRVLGPDGQPVSGARLRVTDPLPRRFEVAKEALTRSDGTFELEGLEMGPTTVDVVHLRYPRETRKVELRGQLHRLDVTLDSGFEVSGRVTDDAYAPVIGAKVTIEGSNQARRSALSDTGGDFHFAGLPAGTYLVRAVKGGYADARAEVHIDEAGFPDSALELELTAGGAATGRVIGLEPAELGQVVIEARRFGGTSVGGTVDFEGSYRLEHLAVGDWIVDASLHGTEGRRVSRPVTIEAGAPEAILDLDFGAGLVLAGEILHAGRPLSGALVALVHEDLVTNRGDRSDQEGRYRLTGLDPGIYELTVNDLDTGLFHSEVIELETDRELLVELESRR